MREYKSYVRRVCSAKMEAAFRARIEEYRAIAERKKSLLSRCDLCCVAIDDQAEILADVDIEDEGTPIICCNFCIFGSPASKNVPERCCLGEMIEDRLMAGRGDPFEKKAGAARQAERMQMILDDYLRRWAPGW